MGHPVRPPCSSLDAGGWGMVAANRDRTDLEESPGRPGASASVGFPLPVSNVGGGGSGPVSPLEGNDFVRGGARTTFCDTDSLESSTRPTTEILRRLIPGQGWNRLDSHL